MIFRFSFVLCAVVACVAPAPSRPHAADPQTAAKRVSRNVAELNRLAAYAEKNRYTVRRIEFVGNATTRHLVLAERVAFVEGELFTVRRLRESVRRLSGLKTIQPVRLRDVTVRLSEDGKLIDLTFRIRERRMR